MPRGENLECVRKKTRGRPKGSKDKLSRNIRERVVQVWDKLEQTPDKSLEALALEDPTWFFDTFGRALIPKEITGDIGVKILPMEQAVQIARKVLSEKK